MVSGNRIYYKKLMFAVSKIGSEYDSPPHFFVSASDQSVITQVIFGHFNFGIY